MQVQTRGEFGGLGLEVNHGERRHQGLRGHLKNPNGETTPEGKDPKEISGSCASVPKEPEKDTQTRGLALPAASSSVKNGE